MNYLYILTGLMLSATSLVAQSNKVNESAEKIGDGVHPAFVVYINESNTDDIEKEWKSLMKEYKSEKVSGKDGVFADNITIPSIINGTVDVYARAEKISDNQCKFIVAYDMGGAFLTSSTNNQMVYDAAQKFISDFALKTTKNAIEEKRKTAEKLYSKLKEQQNELEEKKEDLNKDIENYKSKIHKAEEEIVTNKTDQEKKKAEIELQRKLLDEILVKQKNIK